jgi:hypothetical protein
MCILRGEIFDARLSDFGKNFEWETAGMKTLRLNLSAAPPRS